MPEKLRRVIRLDSMPLSRTGFTPEGYLKDTPILTSTGIFEYSNPDGSVRRELRLPEEVFSKKSLRSYKGKPIIITHDAGLVDKDNVRENQVGTILTEGFRDGNDVRADIIIHDTDDMKDSGLKELSLGYNLDLDETPGVWNGEPYDAIQRNIIINHLALVREARAGEQARLNIDSRDTSILKGGKKQMSKKTRKATHRADSVLSQEEFAKAIAEYKARRAERMAKKSDGDDAAADKEVVSVKPETAPADKAVPSDPEKAAEFVRDRRDRRDEECDPETNEEALDVIARQDEDIDILFDIIDTLLAKQEFDEADEGADNDIPETVGEGSDEGEDEDIPETASKDLDGDDEDLPVETAEDCDDENCDGADEEEEVAEDEDDEEESLDDGDEDENLDDDEEEEPADADIGKKLNADSVDRIVRQRVQLGIVGGILNMDGLENMSLIKAKKRVIKAVRPSLRLDGKSSAYINAAFDMAVTEIKKSARKDTAYQKRQMFNKGSRTVDRSDSADAARNRMIKRTNSRNKKRK